MSTLDHVGAVPLCDAPINIIVPHALVPVPPPKTFDLVVKLSSFPSRRDFFAGYIFFASSVEAIGTIRSVGFFLFNITSRHSLTPFFCVLDPLLPKFFKPVSRAYSVKPYLGIVGILSCAKTVIKLWEISV